VRTFSFPAQRCSELEDGAQIHCLFLQAGLPFTLSLERVPPPTRSGSSSNNSMRVLFLKAKPTPRLHLTLAEPADLLERGGSNECVAAVRVLVELRIPSFSQKWELFPSRPQRQQQQQEEEDGRLTNTAFGFCLGGHPPPPPPLHGGGKGEGAGGGKDKKRHNSLVLNLSGGAPWSKVFDLRHPNPFLTLPPAPGFGPAAATLRLQACVIVQSDYSAAKRREEERRRAVKSEAGGGKEGATGAFSSRRGGGERESEDKVEAYKEPDPVAFAPGTAHADEFYATDFMQRVHGGLWGRDFLDG
jgi:hypothetical protein